MCVCAHVQLCVCVCDLCMDMAQWASRDRFLCLISFLSQALAPLLQSLKVEYIQKVQSITHCHISSFPLIRLQSDLTKSKFVLK